LELQTEGAIKARLNMLDPENQETELREAVMDAFVECERIHAVALKGGIRGMAYPVHAVDKAEHALVAVLIALHRLADFHQAT
jgi:hypothetical protein